MSKYRQALINRMGCPVLQAESETRFGKTAYLEAGEGYPVVCLHGAGAGAVTWYPSVSALANHFRVIAPDILGYGESDKPEAAYDRPCFSAWLRDFLDALNITKAHIIGLSQGGAIALQFAIDHPEQVQKLILVDSGGLGSRPSFWPMVGMIWMNNFPSEAANRFNSPYILFNPESRDPNHGSYSVEVLKKPGGKNPFRQGRGAAVSAISGEQLSQIKNQTLVIWGENDLLFPLEQAETAIRLIPDARLHRIKQAGHLPLMDQTEAFNQAVLAFLADP